MLASSYLYVIVANPTNYLLEAESAQGFTCGINIPAGPKVINNHFLDDCLLLVCLDQRSVHFTLDCLYTVCVASDAVVGHKHKIWIITLDAPIDRILWIGNIFQMAKLLDI